MQNEETLQHYFRQVHQTNKPVFAAAWDKNLNFMHVTQYAAKLSGYTKFTALEGLTCYDLKAPAVTIAGEFERQSKKVMQRLKPMRTLGYVTYANNTERVSSSYKAPFYDDDDSLVGTYVICNEVTSPNTLKFIKTLMGDLAPHCQQQPSVNISLEIIDRFESLALTKRESQCFYFLIRGYSNNEIANILHLSKRTIDDYSENIKLKLNCIKRRNIIEYAFAYNLMTQIPESLLH